MSKEAIKHVMATIFSAQNALRELAPEFKWAGMGNVLGDYGEYICNKEYNLKKAPPGSDGYDAVTETGKTVQIKANHSSGTIGFRGVADLLLVIHVDTKGEYEEIYFGDFSQVLNQTSFSARDNKHTITITKLKKIKSQNP